MSPDFVQQFHTAVGKYDQTLFGAVEKLDPSDIYVRNGYSDKLVPVAEVSISEGGQQNGTRP